MAYMNSHKITAGNILNGEYTAAAVTYKDGRIYASGKAEYLIDDDAVVYVKYNTDKYDSVRQGCCWLG